MQSFFITGQQRSGTTLLAVMLSRHPDIYISNNSIAFRLTSCFNNYQVVLPYNLHYSQADLLSWLIKSDYKGRLLKILDVEMVDQHGDVRSLVQYAIADLLKREGRTVFGDKAPNLHYFLGDLLKIVPDAKLLHIVRDGRATALSQHKRGFKNLLLAGQEWVDGTIAGLANLALIGPAQYKLLKYEDLLRNPRGTAKEICAFLDIAFDDIILDIEGGIDIGEEKSYVKYDLDKSRIAAFKDELTARQIRSLEKIQGPLLTQLGYELLQINAKTKYRPLSNFNRIRYNQADNFRTLFRRQRTGMVNRANVQINVPPIARLKRFALHFGRDFLPDRIFKSIFRKVWTKELHYPKDVSAK